MHSNNAKLSITHKAIARKGIIRQGKSNTHKAGWYCFWEDMNCSVKGYRFLPGSFKVIITKAFRSKPTLPITTQRRTNSRLHTYCLCACWCRCSLCFCVLTYLTVTWPARPLDTWTRAPDHITYRLVTDILCRFGAIVTWLFVHLFLYIFSSFGYPIFGMWHETNLLYSGIIRTQQGCIPVGCVPPVHWPYLVVSYTHPPRNHACLP